MTRIQIQHVTIIPIQQVTRIRIQHVMRIRILHVKRIALVQGDDDSEGGWRDRSGYHCVQTKDACVLKEVNDTQGINS